MAPKRTMKGGKRSRARYVLFEDDDLQSLHSMYSHEDDQSSTRSHHSLNAYSNENQGLPLFNRRNFTLIVVSALWFCFYFPEHMLQVKYKYLEKKHEFQMKKKLMQDAEKAEFKTIKPANFTKQTDPPSFPPTFVPTVEDESDMTFDKFLVEVVGENKKQEEVQQDTNNAETIDSKESNSSVPGAGTVVEEETKEEEKDQVSTTTTTPPVLSEEAQIQMQQEMLAQQGIHVVDGNPMILVNTEEGPKMAPADPQMVEQQMQLNQQVIDAMIMGDQQVHLNTNNNPKNMAAAMEADELVAAAGGDVTNTLPQPIQSNIGATMNFQGGPYQQGYGNEVYQGGEWIPPEISQSGIPGQMNMDQSFAFPPGRAMHDAGYFRGPEGFTGIPHNHQAGPFSAIGPPPRDSYLDNQYGQSQSYAFASPPEASGQPPLMHRGNNGQTFQDPIDSYGHNSQMNVYSGEAMPREYMHPMPQQMDAPPSPVLNNNDQYARNIRGLRETSHYSMPRLQGGRQDSARMNEGPRRNPNQSLEVPPFSDRVPNNAFSQREPSFGTPNHHRENLNLRQRRAPLNIDPNLQFEETTPSQSTPEIPPPARQSFSRQMIQSLNSNDMTRFGNVVNRPRSRRLTSESSNYYAPPMAFQQQQNQYAVMENQPNGQYGYNSPGQNGSFQSNNQMTYQGGAQQQQGSGQFGFDPGMQPQQSQQAYETPQNSPSQDQRGAPSHLKICQSIVERKQLALVEERDVCADSVNFGYAMAQIFLSSYLTEIGRMYGFPVEYQHNCNQHKNPQVTFQQMLSSPLNAPEGMNKDMSRDSLLGLCGMILENAKQNGPSNPLDILMWDTNLSYRRRLTMEANVKTIESNRRLQSNGQPSTEPISMLQRLVPLIHTNMYKGTLNSRIFPNGLKFGYGVLKGRDASSDRIASKRAVIFLPCRDNGGSDAVILPYFTFLMHLPISLQVLDIVASQTCVENAPGMQQYVQDLASSARQFAPRMNVELIIAQPSSPDTIARLIEAEYVFCGPGFGLVCLFPALARPAGRVTLFDVGQDQVEGGGDSASSMVARLPPWLANHIQPPNSEFMVSFLTTLRNQEEMDTFAQRSPNPESGDCRFVRGRVGSWIKDMNYAQRAQYRTPLSHYSGNAEKLFRKKVKKGDYGDMVFRPSTTWRWEESRYNTCPVSLITQEGVCNMLKSLNARRIFLLGDSLNLQMAQSFWMWLTNDGESPTKKGTLEPNFKTTIQCGDNYGDYTLQFVRNDELLENDQPVSIDNEEKNCGTYCFPWTGEYMADQSRTILIVNAGAHIHEFPRFAAAVNRFVEVFDEMNRPNDIVLFRTLVPGHWDCGRHGLEPFHNFAEYKKDAQEHQNPKEAIYGWDKFASYNDYAAEVIDSRRFLRSEQSRARMEVVDVFPTGVLRPDGHCSDEFRPPAYLPSDCLHYTLPGPVDWWTHLAFSHLQDIAIAENVQRGSDPTPLTHEA